MDALALARQIEEPGTRRHLLATVAVALRRDGQTDEARKVALEALAQTPDNRQTTDSNVLSSRVEDSAALMVILSDTGMSKESQKAANEALTAARIIADDTKRSGAFLTLAAALARVHSYRQARLIAERCTSTDDKLSASAAILREYTIQHHPESAKAFADACSRGLGCRQDSQ